jgi:hypothetical protein
MFMSKYRTGTRLERGVGEGPKGRVACPSRAAKSRFGQSAAEKASTSFAIRD